MGVLENQPCPSGGTSLPSAQRGAFKNGPASSKLAGIVVHYRGDFVGDFRGHYRVVKKG
jgi:hypothetical protein